MIANGSLKDLGGTFVEIRWFSRARMEAALRDEARTFVALAAMSALLGPVKFFLRQGVSLATEGQVTAAPAFAGVFAGVVLIGIGLARRQPILRLQERFAIVALLLPQVADHLFRSPLFSTVPWLQLPGTGDALLLTLAAPLWLALLAAVQVVPGEVPRATVGAALAALGAACLTLAADSYTPAPSQWVMGGVQLAVLVATVWSWSFARERLNPASFALNAGVFLLLQTAVFEAPRLLTGAGELHRVDWPHAVVPLLLESAATAMAMLLWFWLLTRMPLATFTFHPLAIWITSTAMALALFGLASWREDVALAVGLAALIAGLRARTAEEDPISLELI